MDCFQISMTLTHHFKRSLSENSNKIINERSFSKERSIDLNTFQLPICCECNAHNDCCCQLTITILTGTGNTILSLELTNIYVEHFAFFSHQLNLHYGVYIFISKKKVIFYCIKD